MSEQLILIIAVVIVVIGFYAMYVSVIKKKNSVLEAFSGISVQLKKRYDLIPNILDIANKFMEHERYIMEEVTKLRVQAVSLPDTPEMAEQKFKLDSEISKRMRELMVAVENYPQLKSDNTMVVAMQTYNEVEEHIAAARRFYNSAVRELNNAVEIFPSSMIAAAAGITKKEFFQAEEIEQQPVRAKDYLK